MRILIFRLLAASRNLVFINFSKLDSSIVIIGGNLHFPFIAPPDLFLISEITNFRQFVKLIKEKDKNFSQSDAILSVES